MMILSFLTAAVLVCQPATPKVTAKLAAAHDAVARGGQTELAIEIEVEKDWHLYYPITLDAGLPTTVRFEAPAGFSFGELRFPLPAYGEMAGIGYLGFERTLVILTKVDVAKDVAAGEHLIKAHISAMVCKESCLPVELGASMTLRVAETGGAPAHASLFEAARESTLPPLADAEHIKGTTVEFTAQTLEPDQTGEVVLKVKMPDGVHMQDRDPGNKDLVGARVYIETLDGLKFGEQVWPKAKVKNSPVLGRLRELAGEFEIRQPITLIDDKFASGRVALRVLFTYQVCNEEGICFRPTGAVGVVRFDAKTPRAALSDPRRRGTLLPAVTTLAAAAAAPDASAGAAAATDDATSMGWILFAAFLGGLILNIMPCVFPVIAIKILGFVKQAGEDRRRVFLLGVAFSAGVMVWFWLFGYLTTIGSIPLQNPLVSIALTCVVALMALNLFGVYEIVLPGAAADAIGQAAGREGYVGSFFKGFLATLLGTACTAPFFVTASAYATTQPTHIALLIFTFAGVGMAAPYLLLSAFPQWLKWMPRPGAWMVIFKQAMGFILLLTAVWLLTIVGGQLGHAGVAYTVGFVCFLSISVWLIGKIGYGWSSGARIAMWADAVAIALVGYWVCFVYMMDLREAVWSGAGPVVDHRSSNGAPQSVDDVVAAMKSATWDRKIPWQPYRKGLPEALAAAGYTVYVDYTADWCVTCKANKATSLETASTRARMSALGVIPIEADFTRPDPDIRADLTRYGFPTVPLNVVLPAGRPDDPRKLPVLLTGPKMVIDAIEAAGPSRPPTQATAGL